MLVNVIGGTCIIHSGFILLFCFLTLLSLQAPPLNLPTSHWQHSQGGLGSSAPAHNPAYAMDMGHSAQPIVLKPLDTPDVRSAAGGDKEDDSQCEDALSGDKDVHSYNMRARETFNKLSVLFPDNFYVDSKTLPYWEVKQPSTDFPHLIVDPDLSHTWLDPPKCDTDTIGYWKPSPKFPPKLPNVNPSAELPLPKRPTDIHIRDTLLKDFLEARKISSLNLDTDAFQPCNFDVKSSPLSQVDAFLRSTLLDSYVSDELLAILLHLVSMIKNELAPRSPDVDLTTLDLLGDVIRLAAQSNARGQASLVAAVTYNKVSLRDLVLDKFEAPAGSKNVLRGTSIVGPDLFGQLPESFKTSLHSHQGKGLVCKIKSGRSFSRASTSAFTSSVTPKRSLTPSSYSAPKLPKLSVASAKSATPSPRTSFTRSTPQTYGSKGFRGNKNYRGGKRKTGFSR